MSARAFLGSWRHYVLGALGVAAAFFVRSWLVREFGELPPFVIFYPVVFLVAAIGGTGPGLYTAALAGFVADVWIFGPQGHSTAAPRADVIALLLFMINCSAASVGGGIYRRAREREGILLNARREEEVDFRASQTNAAVESERQRQLLSVTLASIGEGVIVTDSLGKITFMNPEAQRLTGWVGDNARGRSFTEVCRIVDPVKRERPESLVEKVLRTGKKVGLAKRAVLIARDGKETVIDKSGAPVRRESGEIGGVVIVIRDFAEREAADRALRESEERFRQSIEAGSLGTFVHHIGTDLLECDERSREHFGVSGKGPLSEVTRRLHPDDRERVAASIALAWDPLHSDGRCREEYRLVESDGTVKWMLVQARVFFEGQGEARHAARVVGVTQDITARHRDEQALRDSEARLSNVIESLAEGIIVANLGGNEMRLQWNRAALELHDYSSVEEVRRPLQEIIREFELLPVEGGAPLPHEQWPIPRLVRGETVRGVELRFRRLDRKFERIYSYGGARVSDTAGKLQFVLLAITDITAYAEAQISLRQAKEHAESAGRAKDHFLAVVSHELRTPLTPVLAATSELQSRGDLPADVRHDLEMVRRNVELEARLVDDLLTLTRLHRGKIVLHQETINVHSIVRAVVEQFQAEIENKRLELTFALSAIDPYVWADATRFQQALSNLLSNAVKFTPDGGKVAIRTSSANGKFRLEVSDSGIGIEPEVLTQLFNPFEQGERTVTRKFGGLGLGLSIARQFIELHGGSLTAASDGAKQGARFTIELEAAFIGPIDPRMPAPSALAGVSAPPTVSDEQTQSKDQSILLVEDHPDTARILARLLKSIGYAVHTTGTVAEALAAAEGRKFDILLSDIGLPDGSGCDIARELFRRNAITHAVALSGFGQPEDLARSREAGFTDHLIKPINFDSLRDVLKAVATTAREGQSAATDGMFQI